MVARRHPARRDRRRRTRRPGRRTGAAAASTAAEPGTPPPSDYRFIDRLDYMLNGAGFIYDRVDAPVARRRRDRGREPPDRRAGRRHRAGVVAGRPADRVHLEPPAATRTWSRARDIHVVDVATRAVTAITRGPQSMFAADLAAGRANDRRARAPLPGAAAAATTSGCSRRTARTPTPERRSQPVAPPRPDAGLRDEQRRDARRGRVGVDRRRGRPLARASPRRSTAPTSCGGSPLADGRLERLTEGRHYISGWDARRPGPAAGSRIAYLRSTPTEPPDLWLLDGGRGVAAAPRR